MWNFGFAQTRAGWRRLLAAGVAVVLGAAFVAATIAGASLTRNTILRSAEMEMHGADVIMHPMDAVYSDEEIRALPGVDSFDHLSRTNLAFSANGSVVPVVVSSRPTSPEFSAPEITEGREPTGHDEVAVSAQLASRLELDIGDSLEVYTLPWDPSAERPMDTGLALTVTGLQETEQTLVFSTFSASATPDACAQLIEASGDPLQTEWSVLLSTTHPEAVTRAIEHMAWPPYYETTEQLAASQYSMYTGMTNPVTMMSAAFILIALVVAALVVANTFQVLVTQRATTIGILRSVGATRRQVRSLVALEAAAVGLTGGLVGMVLGNVVAYVIYLIVLGAVPNSALEGSFTLTWHGIVLPIVAAVIVTLVAAFLPAGTAARTPPLTAVRKITSPRQQSLTPVRSVGLTLLLIGAATAVVALMMRTQLTELVDVDASPLMVLTVLGLLVFGGGLLLVSPLVFPTIAALLGAVVMRVTPRWARTPVRLARSNLQANHRRTTTTSNALLVGVTLVSMLATGAATAQASFSAVSASMLPTDIVLNAVSPTRADIPGELADKIARLDGVHAVAELHRTWVVIDEEVSGAVYEIMVGREEELAAASYSEVLAHTIPDDTLLVDPTAGLPEGRQVSVAQLPDYEMTWDATPTPDAPRRNLTVVTGAVPNYQVHVNPTTAASLGIDTAGNPDTLWIRVAPERLTKIAETIFTILPSDLEVGVGSISMEVPGLERAQTDEAIDNVILAAASLLGISILIALVGVANTLSLSVFERRREFSLLRSVGLTQPQMRLSLAVEGLIITMAATILGIALGTALGALGGAFLFAGAAGTIIRIPWASIGAIVLIALVAGPLASVLPAKQALASSPVEGMDAG